MKTTIFKVLPSLNDIKSIFNLNLSSTGRKKLDISFLSKLISVIYYILRVHFCS